MKGIFALAIKTTNIKNSNTQKRQQYTVAKHDNTPHPSECREGGLTKKARYKMMVLASYGLTTWFYVERYGGLTQEVRHDISMVSMSYRHNKRKNAKN